MTPASTTPPADAAAETAAAAARDERIEMLSVDGVQLRVSLRPARGLGGVPRKDGGLGGVPRKDGGLGGVPRKDGGLGGAPRKDGGYLPAANRPPLLLCNGIGAPIEMWTPFRDPLGRPTIAFDAPGVGESSVPLFPPTVAGVARLMLKVLDHLDVPTVDVLGVSWGGALAQELARHGGDRVRRLVLCATMAGGLPIPGDPRVLAILATPLRYWSPTYLDRVAPTLYGPDVVGNPEMMAHQRRVRFTRAPSGRGYVWQMLALRRFASVLWLHRLRQPTLVLTGESDPIIPVANGRILAGRIPDARLEVVPGGHLFILTHPSRIAARINAFLDEPDS